MPDEKRGKSSGETSERRGAASSGSYKFYRMFSSGGFWGFILGARAPLDWGHPEQMLNAILVQPSTRLSRLPRLLTQIKDGV